MSYQQYEQPQAQPQVAATGQTVTEAHSTNPALRVFQVVAAVAGGILFVMGIIAVFRVDFGAGFMDTSGSVGGFGFSPAMAIAAILLGGATLAVTLADQDRGVASFVGLLTLLVGIAALALEGQIPDEVGVDRRSALLFVVLGAIVFVASLVPWISRRRRVTTYR